MSRNPQDGSNTQPSQRRPKVPFPVVRVVQHTATPAPAARPATPAPQATAQSNNSALEKKKAALKAEKAISYEQWVARQAESATLLTVEHKKIALYLLVAEAYRHDRTTASKTHQNRKKTNEFYSRLLADVNLLMSDENRDLYDYTKRQIAGLGLFHPRQANRLSANNSSSPLAPQPNAD